MRSVERVKSLDVRLREDILVSGRDVTDSKRRTFLDGPVLATLLKLALPTVGVLSAQTVVSIAETYWTSFLGTDALAGVALVFPLTALMIAMSNGGIGGGVTSAIARAVGAGRRDEARELTTHALVLAIAFGLFFTLGALIAGPHIYRAMGGTAGALAAAVTFSAWLFVGSVPIWIVNLLAAALRGAGEVRFPALVTLTGAAVVVPLSPMLIFGLGPLPRMGVAGAGLAVTVYYCGAAITMLMKLTTCKGPIALQMIPLRRKTFGTILGVGSLSAVGSIAANLTVLSITGAVGSYGITALAGYGIASRLDWLLIPLQFGFGVAVVTMVGAATGAQNRARARKITLVAILVATTFVEVIGICAAIFAPLWLEIFTRDPKVIASGTLYLHTVAPAYGAVSIGLMLYFSAQGQGRVFWPLVGGFARLLIASGGGYLLVRLGFGVSTVFADVAAGSIAFAVISAIGMLTNRGSRDATISAPFLKQPTLDPHSTNVQALCFGLR